ncbi:hypothetical protein SPI_00709 [Niveomyces insectorum RCEF 264]|uniref:Integral membrane protein n=1 Tax=Niveomyces insectorum RCEF 264 TaxID=1081102 RepID=A0A162LC70_9HYPO|nr:hypothetical protein SPI_00709 [Niveomyces insectorum RCEF 264]
MSSSREHHLPGRIAHAATVSGPFSFLNPTTRYVAVPAKSPQGVDGRGTPKSKADSNGQPRSTATPAGGGEGIAVDSERANNRSASSGDGGSNGEGDGDTIQGDDTEETSPPARPLSPFLEGVYHVWRSRDNRKGRHAVLFTRDFLAGKAAAGAGTVRLPPPSNSLRGVLHCLWKMAVRYPVWDISYNVAVIFTLGSVVWIINAFFVWLPLEAPSANFPNEETTGGGVSALVGATIFEVGAILGMLEAVNENRAECFGWALEEALESGSLSLQPNPAGCQHSHAHRRGLFSQQPRPRLRGPSHTRNDGGGMTITEKETGRGTDAAGAPNQTTIPASRNASPSAAAIGSDARSGARQWSWWPSWNELRTVYVWEMGFWACATQMAGATIFWISGFTGLPPITNRLSVAAYDGIFWVPQVVGGTGFIVSSTLFMLETQHAWYVPAPHMLGWHIGFWNLVGGIGFTLCGAFGFAAGSSANMQYASTLSTFIGSWAFLIGSVIQWYESLDKYPVQIEKSSPERKQQ